MQTEATQGPSTLEYYYSKRASYYQIRGSIQYACVDESRVVPKAQQYQSYDRIRPGLVHPDTKPTLKDERKELVVIEDIDGPALLGSHITFSLLGLNNRCWLFILNRFDPQSKHTSLK